MSNLLEQYNDICEFNKTGWCHLDFVDRKISLSNYIQKVFDLDDTELALEQFINLIIPNERDFFRVVLKLFIYNKFDFNHSIHFEINRETFPTQISLKRHETDSADKVMSAKGVIKIIPDTKEFSGPLLNTILQYIPMYFFIKDVEDESRYIYCSPMMKTLFRFHRNDPIGRTDYELFGDPDIAHFFRIKDLEVCENGQPQHYTEKVIDSAGNSRIMDTIKVLMKRENKSPCVLGLAWDLTYQKEIETLLLENNMRVHMACKAASIYPWTWDLKSRIATLTYIENNNITTKEITHNCFIATVHENDLPVYINTLNCFIDGGEEFVKLTFRTNHFNEDYTWFELTGKVYEYDDCGIRCKAVGILRDVTELKNKDAILEESDRMKSSFLANMTHEIRTPLNAITGFSSLLIQAKSEEERTEYIKIIEQNNRMLLQLINDILDISSFEAGRPNFNFTEFPLDDIFISQQQLFQNQSDPGIKFVFEKGNEEYLITSDQVRINQVIRNLLSNAVKFTTEGTIKFGYKPTDEGIYVYVNDQGCGIPAHVQPFIFGRFVQADNFTQGTGLGLSVCHAVITSLNGKIGVRSEEGKGSLFWFTIPCEKRLAI